MIEAVLDDLSTDTFTAANEANHTAYNVHRVSQLNAAVFDGPDMVMRVTSSPVPILNFVTRARLVPGKADASVAKVVGRFREKGVPGFWYVSPLSTPPELGRLLVKHGFVQTESRPGMGIDLETLEQVVLPEGLAIEPIRNEQQLRAWVSIILPVFGAPESLSEGVFQNMNDLGWGPDSPAQNYLGSLDGKPVAISTVFYGAGVAGIYSVATLPDARGRGIGAAMTLQPLLDARDKGYRAAVLQSSPMGLSVYQKIGFRETCRINVYLWQPG